jgi:hypothetical protein
MTELKTSCACCGSGIIIQFHRQKKEIHLVCGCKLSPFICQSCSDRTGLTYIRCIFCSRTGNVVSGAFDPFSPPKWSNPVGAKEWILKWRKIRERHWCVTSILGKSFLNNWNYCYLLQSIVTHTFVWPFHDPKLKENFFKSWFQAQIYRKRSKISICYARTSVNSHFLRRLKSVTFVRLVIRNLCGGRPYTQRLMDAICARILANFKSLFEISLKL